MPGGAAPRWRSWELLACFIVLPAANYVTFAGIPFDSLPQYVLLLAFVPIVIWPWLRDSWCARWPGAGRWDCSRWPSP